LPSAGCCAGGQPCSLTPRGIAATPDGLIWFADSNSNSIVKLDPTTGIMTFFAIPSNGRPTAITLGPDGALWFCENAGNKIMLHARLCYRKFSRFNTQFSFAGVPDPTQPNVLYIDGQVWGNTGTHAGQAQYLNSFTNLPTVDRTNIAVVLTSTPVTGTGSNGKYTVSAFATIQLITFQLTGNSRNLTFIYRGAHACDAYSNQPPTCQIVSPAYGQVFTSWNFTNGSVPIAFKGE